MWKHAALMFVLALAHICGAVTAHAQQRFVRFANNPCDDTKTAVSPNAQSASCSTQETCWVSRTTTPTHNIDHYTTVESRAWTNSLACRLGDTTHDAHTFADSGTIRINGWASEAEDRNVETPFSPNLCY